MRCRTHISSIRISAAVLSVSLMLSGCAGSAMPFSSSPFGSTGAQPDYGAPQASVLDRSIAGCAASVGGGLLVDLLGKKKKPGAGTVVGVAICGVILAVNNEEDKKRIRDSQRAAISSGQSRTDQYVRADGRTRIVKTSVTPALMPTRLVSAPAPDGDRFVGPCRRVQTEITAQEQGTSPLDPEMVCRTERGNWLRWPDTNMT